MFTRREFFLGMISIAVLLTWAQAATLHGTIYEWSDFEKPLKNALVEVNSTPVQNVVATAGTYSFNLSPGSYLIKAKYYRNNILEYSTEEEIRIDTEGDFVHDLLLFPPTDSDFEYLGDINLTSMDIKSEYNMDYYLIIILISALSVLTALYLIKKKKSTARVPVKDEAKQPPEDTGKTAHRELPDDLRNLYDTITLMGGRTTQKDLRKKMACSEAKVSLMLDDLENRGLIQKIKKGRANIIIAEVKK